MEENQNTISEKQKKVVNKIGVVEPMYLNLREAPVIGSKVLAVLAKGTKVTIYSEFSDEEFYKVKSGAYVGYCMKKFITVAK